MFVIDQRTKEEQDRRNHEERTAWENNVIWIFWGFLAVFMGIAALDSATGILFVRFLLP